MLLKEYYNNKSVLVTGGCGFIGSHIAQRLVEYGAHVTIVDDLSTGNRANIASIIHAINFVEASIVDVDICMQLCKNQHFVFHQAAYISVPGSIENPLLCHENNVLGTFNLLEAARRHTVQRFVFASSAAVYGQREGICHEQMEPAPTSPYGFSKLLNEIYAQYYATRYSLNTIGLRYFNVYGTHQNPHGSYAAIVAKLTHQMALNESISIFGDGTQTRDFVPVSTVVDANLTLASIDPIYTRGELFNIATGKSISLLTLIQKLLRQYPDYRGDIQFLPKRPGDIAHSQADCSKYQKLCDQFNVMLPTQNSIQIE
jgi:UDP-N-acetylglucosamine 4-epimerase